MTINRRIALVYGDSVFLVGIVETLRLSADLEVMELKVCEDFSLLANKSPDVVIVDAAQTTPNQIEELMDAFPAGHSPPFLRLSADDMLLTVISAQRFPAVNVLDLTQALEKIAQ